MTAMIKTLALLAYLLVLLIHVYIVVLEMVLWKTRGPKVFRITPEKAAETAAMASNQGLYNGFLVAALVIGLVAPDPAINAAFALFGLICVAVAGIWGPSRSTNGFSSCRRCPRWRLWRWGGSPKMRGDPPTV